MFNTIKKEHIAISVLIFLVIAVGFYFWKSSNAMLPLYTEIDEVASAKISSKLDELKIPYEVDNSGLILVKGSDKSNIKLQLASDEVIATEAVGLEVFNDLDYGMTEFSQKVHYQRALQGELARSITNIEGVKFARVHLSLPEKRLFKGDQSKASAAVSLTGDDITTPKLNSIKELVAASIEGLSAADVVITDSKGNLFNAKQSITGNVTSKLEQKTLHESRIKDKINTILASIIEREQYNLSVNVDLNYNTRKQTNNDFLKSDSNIVLKKTITGNSKKSKSENIEYGYGTKVESIEYSIGEVDRISAGIIITKPVNEELITRLKEVITAAVGLQEQRGDKLSLVSLPLPEQNKPMLIEPIATNEQAVQQVSNIEQQAEPVALESSIPQQTINTQPVAKGITKSIPVKAGFFEHPLLSKQNLLIALAVLLFIFIISIFALKPKRLSSSKREALLKDVHGWLKE